MIVMAPSAPSPRELQILAGLAHGETRKEVATRLRISPHTVASHLRSLYRRLGVEGSGLSARLDAMNALGWIRPPEDL